MITPDAKRFRETIYMWRGSTFAHIKQLCISGHKTDVSWMTVPCKKCLVQATCCQRIRSTIAPAVHMKEVRPCFDLYKWMADWNQYIDTYSIGDWINYMRVSLVPRYGR